MSKLSFALTGVVTKHSTEVKNGLIFKRLNIKCVDTCEITDLLEELAGWGKATDPISNLHVISNVDDDPDTVKIHDLSEYGICLNLEIQGESIPVQLKTIKVAIKKKKVKDFDGEVRWEKYREANITLEKQELDWDLRWNTMFLKHTEPNDEGKEVIQPLPMNFTQIEPFSLFDDPLKTEDKKEEESDDSEGTEEMPQVFQNG